MNRISIAKGLVAITLASLAFGASAAPRHHGAHKHHHHRHHHAMNHVVRR